MPKFYGSIGFYSTTESAPGVWSETVLEKPYFGELTRQTRRLRDVQKVNDSLSVSMQVSILMDPYLQDNFQSIRYVKFMNSKWKVDTVDVVYPRLNLTLGALYNE